MPSFLKSAVVLILLAQTAAAEAQATGPWSVRGGANYTWYSDPLGPGHGPHTGHSASGVGGFAGLGYEYPREGDWGVALEMDVALRNAGYEFDETSYPASFLADGSDRGRRTMRSALVEFPALLVYRGWAGLRVEAGPYVSRLLHAVDVRSGTRWSNGNEMDLHEQVDRTGDLAPWEFGGVLGVLVEGPNGVCMHLRYVAGFTDLDRAIGSSPSSTSQVQIALAVALPAR